MADPFANFGDIGRTGEEDPVPSGVPPLITGLPPTSQQDPLHPRDLLVGAGLVQPEPAAPAADPRVHTFVPRDPRLPGPAPQPAAAPPPAPLPLVSGAPSYGGGGMLPQLRPGPAKMVVAGRNTSKSSTTESGKLSEESKANLAQQNKQAEASKETEREAGKLSVQRAEIDSELATRLTEYEADRATREQATVEEANRIVATARSDHEKAVEAHKNHEFKDYWSTRSDGQKIMAAIALALSGFGSAISGRGGNPALVVLQQKIRDDYVKQRDQLAKLKDDEAMSRAGVDDARLAKQELLADNLRKEAGALGKIKTLFEARLSKLGVGAEQIATDQRIQQIEQNRLAKEAEALKITNQKTSETVNKTVQLRRQEAATAAGMSGVIYDHNGRPIAALGKDRAKEAENVNKEGAMFRTLRGALSELKSNVDKYGYEWFDSSEASQQRNTIKGTLTGALKEDQELGALDNGVKDLVNSIIGGDVTAMQKLFGTESTSVSKAIELADSNWKNRLNSHGLPADTFYAPTVGNTASAPGGSEGVEKIAVTKDGRRVRVRVLSDGRVIPM